MVLCSPLHMQVEIARRKADRWGLKCAHADNDDDRGNEVRIMTVALKYEVYSERPTTIRIVLLTVY